jgi:RNA polymerase sigma factor (sigma-70 family)
MEFAVHYDRLLAQARRSLAGGNLRCDADDLVQAAMVRAREKRAQLRSSHPAVVTAWLRRVLWTVYRNMLREERRRPRLQPLPDEGSSGWMAVHSILAASGVTPSGVLMREELERAIRKAVERLPPAQHEAVFLLHYSGWQLKAIAEEMCRSPEAVAGLLQRAYERLERSLRGVL